MTIRLKTVSTAVLHTRETPWKSFADNPMCLHGSYSWTEFPENDDTSRTGSARREATLLGGSLKPSVRSTSERRFPPLKRHHAQTLWRWKLTRWRPGLLPLSHRPSIGQWFSTFYFSSVMMSARHDPSRFCSFFSQGELRYVFLSSARSRKRIETRKFKEKVLAHPACNKSQTAHFVHTIFWVGITEMVLA